MNKKAEDLYIALIRYGRGNLEEGVSFIEARDHLRNNGFKYSDVHLRTVFPVMYLSPGANLDSPNDVDPVTEHNENRKRFLRLDSYFYLLEYEELNEARQQAKSAKTLAIIAISISIVLAFVSVYFSYYQITHPQDVIIKNQTEEKQ